MDNQPTFEAFLEAVKTGNLTGVDSFLANPQGVNQVTSNENQALRWAAHNGHLPVVNRLLEFDSVVTQVTACNNCAFNWAAQNGHLPVVNRLLEFDAVVTQVTARENYALRWSAIHGHMPVVNRLLEIASVRQADIGLLLTYPLIRQTYPLIRQGLKRALWLSLQKAPGFSEISTPGELTHFANNYLRQHPDWVHASFTKRMKDTLIQSLPKQVLAFAYNSPFYTLHRCAPSFVITKSTSPELPPGLIEHIETYVGPQLKGMSHFSEPRFEPTQTLAFKLHRRRYSSAHTKADAPNNSIAMSAFKCLIRPLNRLSRLSGRAYR